MSSKAIISTTSTPSFFEFNPKFIPWQYRLLYDIEKGYDYHSSTQYILLSGSVGSAKSIMLAFTIIRHCMKYAGARVCLGRKALPDLKDTIFTKILEMLYGSFIDKRDYFVRHENGYIKFSNGSEVISRSWHDKKYKKFRSLELSMLVIEELTENDLKDWEFWDEAIARVGRLPHVKENIVLCASNPSDPSHPAYTFFIQDSKKTNDYYAVKEDEDGVRCIHTYYSLTEQNPFLPKSYIRNLRKRYDDKMIKRMLLGQWIYISSDVIFYNYDEEIHVVDEIKIDKHLPLRLCFDFNISKNNPMSSALMQYLPKARNKSINTTAFRFLDEVAIEGARTLDALEEWAGKGYFDLPHNPEIIIHGDATGRRGDSRGKLSDYDIIEKYLANYVRKDKDRLEYSIEVPSNGQNPPLRERHNITNGVLKNSEGEVGLLVAKDCKMIRKGFQNTRLKDGASYVEDQSTEGQDISTACTYGLHWCVMYEEEEVEEISFY